MTIPMTQEVFFNTQPLSRVVSKVTGRIAGSPFSPVESRVRAAPFSLNMLTSAGSRSMRNRVLEAASKLLSDSKPETACRDFKLVSPSRFLVSM